MHHRPEPTPKVLCIDDDPDVSRAIQLRLDNFEVEVIPAFFGTQGLGLAVTEKPDVIITDLKMPQGGGEYLLECLKCNAKTVDIPVIVLTGKSDENLPARMYRLGAAKLLKKPIAFDELVQELRRYIELRERTAQP